MNEWIEVAKQLPKENVVVETKIDDGKGCRNEQELFRRGNLWFIPSKQIYVYYKPTHWRQLNFDDKSFF